MTKFRNKKILFISSTVSAPESEVDTYDYFAAISSELAINLQRRNSDIDLVLKVPEAGKGAIDQQIRFISDGIKFPDNYECIIVSPIDITALYDMMKPWINSYGKNRIIFIDQGFNLEDYPTFHDDDIARPPFVQADWTAGGVIAAQSMMKVLIKRQNKCPNILLLTGKVGSKQRIEGFKKYFHDSEKPGEFIPAYTELNGEYNRKKTIEVCIPYFHASFKDNKTIEGIFATNDEMAIGVREAFNKVKEQYPSQPGEIDKIKSPIIIGFDGIKDVTLLIDKKDPNELLYDTVDVKLKAQIKKLTDLVETLIINKGACTKFHKENCISYRELKKMN